MSNKVSGAVHLIEETKTFGQKGFRKRLVVLEQDKGSFTNYIPIEFTKDLCDEVDGISVGDEISVAYRLNGRKWQKDAESEVRFFLAAEALSFEVEAKSQSAPPAEQREYRDEDIPF
jgi:hypothetical protein